MNTRLCPHCGCACLYEDESVCLDCESTLAPVAFNTLCDCGRNCSEPVESFCVCGTKPLWLCERHRQEHEIVNPPHLISPVEAYRGVEKFGFSLFKENFLQAISVRSSISAEQQRIFDELRAFSADIAQIRSQLASLEQYASNLQSKFDRLEHLKAKISENQSVRRVNAICSQFMGEKSENFDLALAKFVGKFETFDVKTAVGALELRQKEEIEQQEAAKSLGLTHLSLVVSLLSNPTNPVPTGARMCFLFDSRLFVCGGQQTKSAFFFSSAKQREAVSNLRFERESHGIVQFRDCVYVFGGLVDYTTSVKSWECYSLATGMWENGKMKYGRQFFNPGVYREKIFIAGGHCPYGVEVFDPLTRKFEQMRSLPTLGVGGVVLGFENDLVILFDKKIYRHNRDQKMIDQPLDLNEDEGMYSIVAPILDEDGAVYLLLCSHRRLAFSFDNSMQPRISLYP